MNRVIRMYMYAVFAVGILVADWGYFAPRLVNSPYGAVQVSGFVMYAVAPIAAAYFGWEAIKIAKALYRKKRRRK